MEQNALAPTKVYLNMTTKLLTLSYKFDTFVYAIF